MKETLLRAAFAAARFLTCATDEQRQRPPRFRGFCTFAVATVATLALALSACGTYWYRQNTDTFNSGSRMLCSGILGWLSGCSMDASDFSNPTLQRKIPGPNDPPLDGEVVGAVNLSRDDTELYVTEWNSKQSFFAKFNRATGAKKCVSMPENIQMWS